MFIGDSLFTDVAYVITLMSFINYCIILELF